ncbi:MAG: GDYXXLXY domain-containing protein [Moraxellaceae bacterium]
MTVQRSRLLLVLGALLILGAVNFSIWQKQQVLADGQIVLLKLAPVDPRSLMQGDYMILRYDLADQLAKQYHQPTGQLPPKGQLLIEQNTQHVVTQGQLYRGQPLQAGQSLLNYRHKNGQIWLGAESFFFQEGFAAAYQVAEYAELRVDDRGHSVLVGLYDAKLQPIRPTLPKTPPDTL